MQLPFTRFVKTIYGCFGADSKDDTLLQDMLRYAATVFFIIGGVTSISYTFPTIYEVACVVLPPDWFGAKGVTILIVFFLFLVIDMLLSVAFPNIMEKVASGKSLRNRKMVFATISLLALCGCLAWLSTTFSTNGSYIPAEAAVANSKANSNPAANLTKTAKTTSASEVAALFDKDMERLQDADDAKLAALITKAHNAAAKSRSYAWSIYGAGVSKGDKEAVTKWNSLCIGYSVDSAKTVNKFAPNKELGAMIAKKQNALLAHQETGTITAETTKLTTTTELTRDQRRIEAVQLLLGKIGAYATIIGLLIVVISVYMKAGQQAPPSPIMPAPIRYLGGKMAKWGIFGGSGNSQQIDNEAVTNNGSSNVGGGNSSGSFGNSNRGGSNTSQVVTITNPVDNSVMRKSLSEANTLFHRYKAHVESGQGDTITHVAMCRAIYDAIDFVDSAYAEALKKRLVMAGEAKRLISMLGW